MGIVGGLAEAGTVFNPQLAVEQAYNDNVRFVGEGDSGAAGGDSDSVTRLSAVLPVVREGKRSTLHFSYSPSFERHQDLDELDYDSHFLSLGLNTSTSRRSKVSFLSTYARTQMQGRPSSLDEAELFLTGRTNRELFRADLTHGKQLSARWSFRGGLNYGESRFDDIKDFDPAAPVPLEDRTDYGGTVQLGRAVSEKTTVGLAYGLQRFELEPRETTGTSTDETVHSLTFTVDRTVSRRMTLNAAIGGFRSTSDPETADDPRTGAQANLGLTRAYRSMALSLDASHRPSSGGALAGTSTDSALGLRLNGAALEPWSWSVSSRLARRDPTNDDEEPVHSVAAGGSLERGFARVLALRLSADYVDQTSDEPLLEARYYTAGIGLVWYPLGRTILGGGKS